MTDTTPAAPKPFRYVDEDGFCLSARLLPDLNTGRTTATMSITIEGSDEPQSVHVPVDKLSKALEGIADAAALAVARQVLGTTTGQPETETPAVDRATVLRERADFFEDVLRNAADPGADPRYWSAISDVIRGLRQQAAEAQQPTPAPAEETPVVAYRDPNNPHRLFCRTHGERWAGLSPLKSHDLPHGGICTLGHASGDKCGRDVLAATTEEPTR